MPEAQPGQAEQGQAQGEDQGGQSQQGQKKAGQKSSDSMKKKQTGQTEGGTDKKKVAGNSSGTTGATDKASKISIPEGKRSQVAKSFSSHKVKHTDIDINVSLGVAVPASVVLYPVPVDIVEMSRFPPLQIFRAGEWRDRHRRSGNAGRSLRRPPERNRLRLLSCPGSPRAGAFRWRGRFSRSRRSSGRSGRGSRQLGGGPMLRPRSIGVVGQIGKRG